MTQTEKNKLPVFEDGDSADLVEYSENLAKAIENIEKVVSIVKVKTEGLIDTYTVTYASGKTENIEIKNGATELLNIYVDNEFNLVVETSENIEATVDDEFNLIITY